MTDTETLAVISSALVGIVAIVASALSARGSRTHAERMAREARDQTRREGIYVDLLAMMGRFSALDDPNVKEGLDPPTLEDFFEILMRAQVLGSEEVARLTTEWVRQWTVMRKGEPTEEELKAALGELRSTAADLRTAIRRELHGV